MAKEKSVVKDQVVSIHYTVKDEKGVKVESSRGSDPLVYLHGHNQVISGLEKALQGKKVGDKFSAEISPEEGYGDYDEDLVATVNKAQFKEQKQLKVGGIFQFVDQEGNPVVVRITKIDKDSVVIDQNHPFAGQNLVFDLEVVKIRPATKTELEHGHAH